eukprot:1822693-Lingulodinium_polyedra.AAC.1
MLKGIICWEPASRPELLYRHVGGLRRRVPGSVMVAAWRTVFNGWCTSQRFGQEPQPCKFCGAPRQDCLYHVPNCSR